MLTLKTALSKMQALFPSFAAAALVAATLAQAPICFAGPQRIQNYVMSHLGQVDHDTLKRELTALKTRDHVDAVSVDMWWGLIEPQMASKDSDYHWDYYKMFFEVAKEVGIGVIPIFSFHAAGGNVGDTISIPLPSYVWTLAPDMKFEDANGFASTEVAAYNIPEVYARMGKVIESFAENFKQYDSMIPELYVVPGPAGELRYPSYRYEAGWNYPDPGLLQAYSNRSKNRFRDFLVRNYHTVDALNAAWHLNLKSFADVQPPSNLNDFYANGMNTPYGRDLLNWYQEDLELHAQTAFSLAQKILRDPSHPFSGQLMAKLAGIHWLYGDPNMPHAAERAAGYYDYSRIVKIFADFHAGLTLTSLEYRDRDWWPEFSQPEELIAVIAALAHQFGVPISGENAVAMNNSANLFQQIRNVLMKYGFSAFTLLRIEDLVNADGSPGKEASLYDDNLSNVPMGTTSANPVMTLHHPSKHPLNDTDCDLDLNF